jgi:two-component system, cell cycle response regulator
MGSEKDPPGQCRGRSTTSHPRVSWLKRRRPPVQARAWISGRRGAVMEAQASVLVVDDDPVNRLLLAKSIQQEGHRVTTARNGREALTRLRAEPFDIVLLDVLMPELDGLETLEEIKRHPQLRHVGVIMVSGLEDIDSVVRCIETGAEDYLPKPFDPVLLRARINGSLTRKRLHDLELEYIQQVGYVAEAAAAVEDGAFEPGSLDPVAQRGDALGQLARVFQRMAREVSARERALKQQVQQLRIEIDEAQAARQVAEITETDYFQGLQQKVDQLRSRSEAD